MISAFLVIATIMISGLFIRAYLPERDLSPAVQVKQPVNSSASDTTIKDTKKEQNATYSRHSETWYKNGEPQEAINEEFQGDEDLSPLFANPPAFEFEMPIGEVESLAELAPLDEMPPLDEMAPVDELSRLAELNAELAYMNFNFEFPDTVPGSDFYLKSERSREDFEKAFTEKFRERFSDFYKKNQAEFEKMIKDVEANVEKMRTQWSKDAERNLMRANREFERMAPRQEQMMRHQEEMAKRMEGDLNRKMQMYNKDKWKIKDNEGWKEPGRESRSGVFEKKLTEQLVTDGYLGKDEKVNTINWEDDGNITVNGKKIKDADRKKYHELHEMYFRERGRFKHTE